MQSAALNFYTAHDRLTHPGEHADLVTTLPTDLDTLHTAIQGVLIHLWKVRQHHPHLLANNPTDVFTRHMRQLLTQARTRDPQPLTIARPLEQRLIVDCRQFAVLLCTVLRQHGIPARPRCGFATYLEDTHYEDHWVCEYWNAHEQRWVMEDPDLQRHDVPPDQFITGLQAWQLCRQDASKGDLFGFDPDLRGTWVARVNLVRDFAALNGFASVTGDSWGIAMQDESTLTPKELALLDQAAHLGMTDDHFAERQSFYATNAAFRVPPMLPNYDHVMTNTWRTVAWEHEP